MALVIEEFKILQESFSKNLTNNWAASDQSVLSRCFQIRFSFSAFEFKAILLFSTILFACKMANSDPVNANGSTENCEMTKLVKELIISITSLEQTVKCQEDTIRILNKNVDELQNAMSAQEKYSRKDCLILKNFPINPFSKNFYNDVCKAIYHYFNYQITPDRIKAYHPLKPFKNGITPIIVKIYLLRR